MYTSQDEDEALALLKKRGFLAIFPAALALVAAVAVFVAGRIARSDTLWILTAALTILGGAYFLFLNGVWVKPARDYLRHVRRMRTGRLRETVGVLTSFAEGLSERDGLWCHALMMNLGSGEPEDDRLYYYDDEKPRPSMPVGSRVRVLSNDNMVADIRPD